MRSCGGRRANSFLSSFLPRIPPAADSVQKRDAFLVSAGRLQMFDPNRVVGAKEVIAMKIRTSVKAGAILWGDCRSPDAKEVIDMKVRTANKAGCIVWGG